MHITLAHTKWFDYLTYNGDTRRKATLKTTFMFTIKGIIAMFSIIFASGDLKMVFFSILAIGELVRMVLYTALRLLSFTVLFFFQKQKDLKIKLILVNFALLIANFTICNVPSKIYLFQYKKSLYHFEKYKKSSEP